MMMRIKMIRNLSSATITRKRASSFTLLRHHHLQSQNNRLLLLRPLSSSGAATAAAASTNTTSSTTTRKNDNHNNDVVDATAAAAAELSLPSDDRLTFHDFVHGSSSRTAKSTSRTFDDVDNDDERASTTTTNSNLLQNIMIKDRTFHIKTYGCQMNVNDTDIVRSLLLDAGMKEQQLDDGQQQDITHHTKPSFQEQLNIADVYLTNTCSIREKAESKVFQRLHQLRAVERKMSLNGRKIRNQQQNNKMIVGVLGCMAERLKEDLLQDGLVDLVVGPDAYRDLPNLLGELFDQQQQVSEKAAPTNTSSSKSSSTTKTILKPAVNVQLSKVETYDDIVPVVAAEQQSQVSSFVTIQRGCSNRCSFCVVPFTRGGVERSRPIQTIVDEVCRLYETQGIKEVTLLGQNVNSYHDTTTTPTATTTASYGGGAATGDAHQPQHDGLSNSGFRRRQRKVAGDIGYTFVDLLDQVSDISPELRVRYTSPHPKDYPPPLLELMRDKPNVCNHLHMPAQSGSSRILKQMKRGYTREAYLQLIDDVYRTIPDVAISTDLIAGFCSETEDDHHDTLSLLQHVQYDQAYLFAYSVREGTYAHKQLHDSVPADIKQRRLQELIDTYHEIVHEKNSRQEIGRLRLVLVEGPAKKKKNGGDNYWTGRTDQNKRVLFTSSLTDIDGEDDVLRCWSENSIQPILTDLKNHHNHHLADASVSTAFDNMTTPLIKSGDYLVVEVTEAKGHTLRGNALYKTTLSRFASSGLGGIDSQSIQHANALIQSINTVR